MKRIFTKDFWSERDMELFIGKQLRYGVLLSCVITIIGGVFYFIQRQGVMHNYSPIPDGEPFGGADVYLRSFSSIISGVLALDGAAIIQLGVCVLIATPVLRVMVSAVAFLLEKDYMYVVITCVVLATIIGNMILAN